MGSPVQEYPSMKKVFVLAVIGAACSSVAFAGEVQTKAPTPVVKTTIMSDAQMDKVTAGAASNVFVDGSGTLTGKVTGSVDVVNGFGKNGGAFLGDQGAPNINIHI